MGWFDDSADAHDQVYGQEPHNEAKFSHELIGGAAAFGAMKMWEDKQRRDGKTVNHAFAKEAIAAIAGAEADKLAETYGRDEYDREKAKHHAEQRSRDMYEEHYGSGDGEWSPDQPRHERFENSRDVQYYSQDQY